MNTLFRQGMILLVVVLAGCKSLPATPEDKYFRLEPVQLNTAPTAIVLSEPLYVAPVRAEGPYAERAMLYATGEQSRELQQFHYQNWSQPPALMLQEHIRASFAAMAIAPQVTDVITGGSVGYLLNAKVLRLERLTDRGNGRAVVSLQFALQRQKTYELLLQRSYSAEEPLRDATQHSYVLACEAALHKLYAQFAEDLRAVK